ncbi:hypothetical protein ECANGB1_2121 [Enterospora canceri]|uniref:Uncharacterized protein n=1 Tax=Enterospora canceri TaxID=1081671 RepID=A0A1Y1S5R6_9MICR|nr:hypothetical protein ECANGB1_2121 [Enterospora canceri]
MAEITKDTTTTTTTTRETGRDHGDARQPFIPGKREIIAEIRGVNEQLRRIEEEMKRSSGRIHEIIKKEKENS